MLAHAGRSARSAASARPRFGEGRWGDPPGPVQCSRGRGRGVGGPLGGAVGGGELETRRVHDKAV